MVGLLVGRGVGRDVGGGVLAKSCSAVTGDIVGKNVGNQVLGAKVGDSEGRICRSAFFGWSCCFLLNSRCRTLAEARSAADIAATLASTML